jgi:hypothetical protein
MVDKAWVLAAGSFKLSLWITKIKTAKGERKNNYTKYEICVLVYVAKVHKNIHISLKCQVLFVGACQRQICTAAGC